MWICWRISIILRQPLTDGAIFMPWQGEAISCGGLRPRNFKRISLEKCAESLELYL